MKVSDFDYELPEHFIAQEPVEPRDASRLMVLNRETGDIEHHIFRDIAHLLDAGDVLVLNNTRVIPARLQGVKAESGGAVEVLLLRQLDDLRWRVLVGGKRIRQGTIIAFPNSSVTAEVIEVMDGAERIIAFSEPVNNLLAQLGEMPLPPYIHHRLDDGERYQTVYSRHEGSAAAPTAGLHFTPELLIALREKGVKLAYCTLHIGLDTFQPVRVENVREHKIHSEFAELTPENAQIINEAKLAGKRIIAVGTTSARTLETAGILSAGGSPERPEEVADFCPWRPVTAFAADTQLFIYPGYKWRVVDAMITNFHLPKSTLLMMISAFAGREHVLQAYEIAKQEGYRFYSLGDAMFIR
ncbi:MAG: tRNA preQ1(34) S-adenosylmethionine ribosyltransferase-isomerase QueA [Chloroflexi bacterium]|nr:MAG: tRNA preQ1(34) S-adenosylmethionine ribosyltransferase-isomerase QueA [Chloroflexota bacterium]